MARINLQSLAFWIQAGRGKVWVLTCAIVLGVIVFSGYLGYKRETGPPDEWTIEHGLIARELATGNGFKSPVRYASALSRLGHKEELNRADRLPALWHAPLYPLYLSIGYKVLGPDGREWLFSDPEISKGRDYPFFRADRFWLFQNLILLWLSLFLVYRIGALMWSPAVGLLGMAGFFLSLETWQQTLGLGSTNLSMLLILFLTWSTVHLLRLLDPESDEQPWKVYAWALTIGLSCGLLFLSRYVFGVFSLAYLITLIFILKASSQRIQVIGIIGIVAVLTVSPWLVRNWQLTGQALGFAGDAIAFRAGDPTAEPEAYKRSFVTEAPELSVRKLIHKGLAGWRQFVDEDIWKNGGLFFAALFLISLLYRFRDDQVRKIRLLILIPGASFLCLEPFLSSGLLEISPVSYLGPAFCLFGAAFFFVLSRGLSKERSWLPLSMLLGLLAFQALPLLHMVSEPKRLPFQYPPYWPSVFVDVRTFQEQAYADSSGMVADIPAGVAWYSGTTVWAQPPQFQDFSEIFFFEDISIQFFSPALLNKPFLSELKLMGIDRDSGRTTTRAWGDVYVGIVEGDLPRYYPLRGYKALHHNVYVTFRNR